MMEIERKWFVSDWPRDLVPERIYDMDQGYISVRPTVRIRREAQRDGKSVCILCFKGAGSLSREEIELEIDEQLFERLSVLIGKPLIPKERRDYRLRDGHILEVNHVDGSAPGNFFYAEVEFASEASALAWLPEHVGVEGYLTDEVTGKQGFGMGSYWKKTRMP